MRSLTVLYDPACRLCAFAAGWLRRQRQLVPLDLVPAGSRQARTRFPDLDHAATRREVTVIGDAGQVFTGDAAWVVCLWALADRRKLAHDLSTGPGRRMARAAVLAAAKYRESTADRGPAPVPPVPPWPLLPQGAAGVRPWAPLPPQGGACAGGCAPPSG